MVDVNTTLTTLNTTANTSTQFASSSANINATGINATTAADAITQYFMHIPSLVAQGDYVAIAICIIAIFFALVLINKISGFILFILKKFAMFLIVLMGVIFMCIHLSKMHFAGTLTPQYTLIAIFGLIASIIAIFVTTYSLTRRTHQHFTDNAQRYEQEEHLKDHVTYTEGKDFKDMFSIDSLKNDKSLLSVLAFIVVAEFGVFSSRTVSAPTTEAGLTIFGVFLLCSFIFIHQSYHHYARGVFHLIVSIIIGYILAVILGVYWSNYSFAEMISPFFFQTEALVAVMTGIGLSLFAGSKG
jgi:hypothetical protein